MKEEQSRKREQQPRTARRAQPSSAIPPSALSSGRKWFFRLVAVLVVPPMVLAVLELVLRVAGFGFDPHFFKQARLGGKDCYVANDDFGLRFFPRSLARIPAPVVVPALKAPETFRVFIFGESAALGDPRPNYGAGCYLEVLLGQRFPQAKFEVINTSMTAINSHVILPIARECARHSGDLWLIYMGNNEMVGPFGAATVFGSRAPPLWLIRAQLELQRLRLGQLLVQLGQRMRKAAPVSSWGGMEMFVHNQVSPADPRKQRVYGNFARNLQDILRAGLDSGAKIVLSTVGVNLKDCPPFGTLSSDELPLASRTTYQQLCADGAAAEAQGQLADAQTDFQRATEIFPQSAEAQFQLANCLLRLTNAPSARRHFLEAVDNDTLPFRADSQINRIIRTAARQFACASLALCDASEALSVITPDGNPGNESFYEHVHLNARGNYALARAWAGQVERLMPAALKARARRAWASEAQCEQWLGLTDWNRVSILEEILGRIQRPPFSGQSGNAQKVALLRTQIEELQRHLASATAVAQAREVYFQSLRRAPEDFRLHENYAEFLEARHELNLAIAERKRVCELVPFYYFPYYDLGVDLKEAGALAQAREALLTAAALRPEQGEIRLELGSIYGREGEWDAAQQQLAAARRLSPEDPRAPLYLGEVLWKLGGRNDALGCLREAIRLDPSNWQPYYRLASDLAQQGALSEAAAQYQEALRLNPGHVKTKLNLAMVLADLGHQPEALQQLNEALQLEPTNQEALKLRRKLAGM